MPAFVLALVLASLVKTRLYSFLLLRATRGARNPNLNVAITHARHVYSQIDSQILTRFCGLPLRMNGVTRIFLKMAAALASLLNFHSQSFASLLYSRPFKSLTMERNSFKEYAILAMMSKEEQQAMKTCFTGLPSYVCEVTACPYEYSNFFTYCYCKYLSFLKSTFTTRICNKMK